MKRLIAIFVLIALCHRSADGQVAAISNECGQLNDEYWNNGKNVTNIDEFPWIGRIAYKNKNQQIAYHCQGVLISKRYVLSAAHCFASESHSAFAVVLGDWDIANNITEIDCSKDGQCAPVPKQYDIQEIMMHPNYQQRKGDNDIALVRLASEVNFSEYIQPICLPASAADENSQQVVATNNYYLAGFGRRIFNEDIGLQKFKTPLHSITLERCRDLFKSAKVADNELCANCQVTNDLMSSSPWMEVRSENTKPKCVYLIGISTRGTRYCGPAEPMIFTKIAPHLDWIRSIINE